MLTEPSEAGGLRGPASEPGTSQGISGIATPGPLQINISPTLWLCNNGPMAPAPLYITATVQLGDDQAVDLNLGGQLADRIGDAVSQYFQRQHLPWRTTGADVGHNLEAGWLEFKLSLDPTSDDHDASELLTICSRIVRNVLDHEGMLVIGWGHLEVTTAEALAARYHQLQPVTTAEFARLCGVTPARIRQFESDRAKAAAAGEEDRRRFPTPFRPGAKALTWSRIEAESFSQTARIPGRPASVTAEVGKG